MTSYINEIKRQLRDIYGFTPDDSGELTFLNNPIPDGCYPMKISDEIDYVIIKHNRIICCNFIDEKYKDITEKIHL